MTFLYICIGVIALIIVLDKINPPKDNKTFHYTTGSKYWKSDIDSLDREIKDSKRYNVNTTKTFRYGEGNIPRELIDYAESKGIKYCCSKEYETYLDGHEGEWEREYVIDSVTFYINKDNNEVNLINE